MALDRSDVYEEAGRLLRYYLDWRARILAGYFATLAALAFAFGWLIDHGHPNTASWVPFVASAVTLVFLLLDRRNRELYRASMDSAAELEKAASIDGVHCHLQRTAASTPVLHSTILEGLFLACALIFLVFGAYLMTGNSLP
jgi:hypothetical protein